MREVCLCLIVRVRWVVPCKCWSAIGGRKIRRDSGRLVGRARIHVGEPSYGISRGRGGGQKREDEGDAMQGVIKGMCSIIERVWQGVKIQQSDLPTSRSDETTGSSGTSSFILVGLLQTLSSTYCEHIRARCGKKGYIGTVGGVAAGVEAGYTWWRQR